MKSNVLVEHSVVSTTVWLPNATQPHYHSDPGEDNVDSVVREKDFPVEELLPPDEENGDNINGDKDVGDGEAYSYERGGAVCVGDFADELGQHEL